MAFSESIKEEARQKAGYACCFCHQPSMSLEVHHLIAQEDNGPDTLDNAVALCPTHHADFGANREKMSRMREMRDWWYKQVENIYKPRELSLILKMSEDLSDIKAQLPDFKNSLKEFMNLRIEQITPENAQMMVSGIIGTTSVVSASPSPSAEAD